MPLIRLCLLFIFQNIAVCGAFSQTKYVVNKEVWSNAFRKLEEFPNLEPFPCGTHCQVRQITDGKTCTAFHIENDLCHMGTYFHNYENNSQSETKIENLYSLPPDDPGKQLCKRLKQES